MFTKRIAILSLAAALALATFGLAPQAEAGRRGHWHGGGLALGIIGGVILGSALAHRHHRYRPYYGYAYSPYYYHGPRYYYGPRYYKHRHYKHRHHGWHRHHRHW